METTKESSVIIFAKGLQNLLEEEERLEEPGSVNKPKPVPQLVLDVPEPTQAEEVPAKATLVDEQLLKFNFLCLNLLKEVTEVEAKVLKMLLMSNLKIKK